MQSPLQLCCPLREHIKHETIARFKRLCLGQVCNKGVLIGLEGILLEVSFIFTHAIPLPFDFSIEKHWLSFHHKFIIIHLIDEEVLEKQEF